MRAQIRDRGFYVTEALGKTRRITPEGFLVCEGVAIARTGIQVYSTQELPLEPDAFGQIRVERLPEEVFRPETIASFEAKAITVSHPDEFVTPLTWKGVAVGTVQNVRQGEGFESDLLLADLLITSADAIAYVNRELPELSPGYEADYEQTAPGRGIQRNIIGNHVALVKRGRAGPRCAIKDEEPTVSKKRTFLDRIRTALKANDTAAIEAEIKEAEKAEAAETTDADGTAVSQLGQRLTTVETGIAEIRTLLTKDADEAKRKAEEEERQRQAAAAAAAARPTLTTDALKEIVARAEILSPGIAIPTADAFAAGDTAQQLMRTALEKANGTTEGAEVIKPFLMGRELKVLTGDALLGVFNGAAELARVRNNQRTARAPVATRDFGKATTVASINEANRKFWANQK